MMSYYSKIFLIFSIWTLLLGSVCIGQTDPLEQHIQVSMRTIGHRLLLNNCDSISRVLPIEKKMNRYKISFESKFQIVPDELIVIVDETIKENNIAQNYIVEVENCETEQIDYSYEVIQPSDDNKLTCRGRDLPLDCYSLYITILDSDAPFASIFAGRFGNREGAYLGVNSKNYLYYSLSLLVLFMLIGWYLFDKFKRPSPQSDPDKFNIGAFQFDQRNMSLSYQNDKTDLTSKEADLLMVLYNSANTTIDRENILKKVWGDEGDYVGRTLDVFISKLRKKLSADENLKIINIRGIGYKFVIND